MVDDADSNQRATLLQEIAHVHFPALTILSVWDNQIQSIEALSSVDMPQIQTLRLSICLLI
jgi:hypothetical protein